MKSIQLNILIYDFFTFQIYDFSPLYIEFKESKGQYLSNAVFSKLIVQT